MVADIEESLRFIERNTRTAYRIEHLQRDEIPEYPVAALREAITNAVMHRDWFNEGANVFVEIYEDRIEVSSPGGLPKGMGRESPRKSSLPRKSPRKYHGSTAEVPRLLAAMEGEMKRSELRLTLGLRNDEHFRKAYLLPALEAGVIEMTLPDAPRSSNQRYRITPRGKEALRKHQEDNN